MTEPSGDVVVLVEKIAKSLVDAPDEVFVEVFDDGVIELEVAESDVGKVIGRDGRTINAMRAVLAVAALRRGVKVRLEVLDDRRGQVPPPALPPPSIPSGEPDTGGSSPSAAP